LVDACVRCPRLTSSRHAVYSLELREINLAPGAPGL
jgi:hypothetical protein